VANADGTALHTVTPAGWLSSSPTWTPDGRVAFLADKGNGTRAYLVNADGTGLHALDLSLGDPRQGGQLAWGSSVLPSARCR